MDELNKLIEKKLFKLRVKIEYEKDSNSNLVIKELEKRLKL